MMRKNGCKKGKKKTYYLFEKNDYSIKGITLIALVITIIVLLILAGISIKTLTGNNGLIKNARKSKRKNRNSK